ncbi:keywimysin-related RiPP [Streptomyces sp. NPDC003035]
MRVYERPTLTAVGSFRKTGLGTTRGPEKLLVLRFSF